MTMIKGDLDKNASYRKEHDSFVAAAAATAATATAGLNNNYSYSNEDAVEVEKKSTYR